ncbi:hypothetical protein ACPCUV_30335 [Streptomyces platensis]|uniref:hypothetical protein n=1 Tax=Streptomyces platensis TaxID=58346 RepID=UPI003C2B1F1F
MSYSPQPAPSGRQPRPLAPPPAAQPAVTQHSGLKIAVGAGCALVVFGLGVTVGGGKKDGVKPAPVVTGTVTAKTAQAAAEEAGRTTGPAAQATAPAAPDTTAGQGSYLVGKDLAAGTYRTAGPAVSDMPLCYWARAKDSSGARAGILASGAPKGPAHVTVNTGETFETNGCQPWTKAG